MNLETTLEQMHGDYNWKEAFAYAGGPGEGVANVLRIHGDNDVSNAPFTLEDVASIFASVDGENDESDWLAFGRLKDKRYFFLEAGCDYTGWD